MTQAYPDGSKVLSPGTLIISTVAPVKDVNNIVRPYLKRSAGSKIFYIPFTKGNGGFPFCLGGSAFAQILNQDETGWVVTAEVFGKGIDMWLRSQGDSIVEVCYE